MLNVSFSVPFQYNAVAVKSILSKLQGVCLSVISSEMTGMGFRDINTYL